ncbi:MAG: peptidoglycan DD-metalloendopeptidase family protein, partial [Chitinophagaceae bacterium]|nr:peptidoglycan DD-metalloendopeptidase family protein [Chitinophagaceae bacterium]
KLNARQKLISNINSEISIIERNIELTNNDVHTLKNELDTLKKQYAEMVRYSYKNRTSTDMIVFLFSSTSFNDAIRRLNYVKQYRNYRADQSVKILSASQQLNNKINVLSLEKKKKDIVLAAQQNQNSILEQETEEKDKMVNELKGKEKELLASIAKNKKAADELNRAISQAIKKEIEAAQQRAMQERMIKNKQRLEKEMQERKALADKKAQEQRAQEQKRKEELAKKLELQRVEQKRKEDLAAAEKQKREAQEKKLLQEQKEREEREKQLAIERKQREEEERKASQLAEAARIQKEKELAIQKQKQEEDARKLALEKKQQEERERKLALEKQKQEEEARRFALEKQKQEEENRRIALEKKRQEERENRNTAPFNNPRYVPDVDKPKFGDVALNTGSSEDGNFGRSAKANDDRNDKSVATNVKTFSSDDYKFSLTPLEREISNNFESSKGKLPWPVEKGYIVERFGKNKHPLFNIYTENYGIDIKTNRGSTARAIFAGEVSSIINIPGTGTTVIINHGTYFTVYAKLSSAMVKKGQRVSIKQSIGSVMTDDDGNTQLNFQVWKIGSGGASVKLNPESWIAQF